MKKQVSIITVLFVLLFIHANAEIKPVLKIHTRLPDFSKAFNTAVANIDTLFITWTGTVSTSWTTAGNWSGGAVPTENDDVKIPVGTAFSPNIPNGTIGFCNSIKVMQGATITVATGGMLNIRSGTAPPGTAALITTDATLITNTSVQLGGTITSIGNCAITQHGIAISTYNNPTISQTIYPDVTISGTGTFSIPVSSLIPATTYYVRAYATNCKGTSYGNEISFTTTGGGGSTDSSYFRLITGGITYFSYDLQSPLATTVFPEGDTRFAYVSRDISTNTFNVTAQSSFLLDASKSFGFSFGYINPDVNSTGTYSFAKAPADGDKSIEITIRNGPGASDATQPNYYDYLNTGNFTRSLTNLNCVETEITSLANTLIINRWGATGEFVEGTINGTLYENIKTAFNCSNSIAKPFVVEFKLKRLQ